MKNIKLKSDISSLKGVGEKKEKELNNLGVFTKEDLIYNFPRKYKDFSKFFTIKNAPLNTLCCIKAKIIKFLTKRLAKNRTVLFCKFCILDEAENINALFFTSIFNHFNLKPGDEFLFVGKVFVNKFGKKEILVSNVYNPDYVKPGFYPVYRQNKNIKSNFIAKLIREILFSEKIRINESLPVEILKNYDLCTLEFALKNVHFPENKENLKAAKKRLIFEEILALQFYLQSAKRERIKLINSVKIEDNFLNEFCKLLPFKLTSSQINVTKECLKDMNSGFAMRRLLQGDVGSGKTVVAAALCFIVTKSTKSQVAFMAPTEILARQHFIYLKNLFKSENINVEFLCSSISLRNKRLILNDLKSNKISILVGTQSLLNEDLEFNNLGLVITDEQHRFGVNQRAKLVNKGNGVHVLVMSATPIPRSLAMILYADLDVSVINEMPKGRQKIDTFIIDSSKRLRALNFIKKQIESGNQGYIVCPLIEEKEEDNKDKNKHQNNKNLELESVIKYRDKLRDTCLKDVRIEILHGKISANEKKIIMNKFINKEIDLLVGTTVLEVGIDVPNANIILIENAERLGLSQLHQLRGRVGRGSFKSFCILVTDSRSKETIKRLNTIKEFTDGFKIAEKDLQLRGPGNLLGSEQHGFLKLKTKDFLTDINVLAKAKIFAKEVIENEDIKEILKSNILKFDIENAIKKI